MACTAKKKKKKKKKKDRNQNPEYKPELENFRLVSIIRFLQKGKKSEPVQKRFYLTKLPIL